VATDHEVKQGDCITSIARDYGFYWETIWNHPKNAELKRKRKDPNILKEGDVVHVPDLDVKEYPRGTEKRHTFMIRGVPAKLRLRIMEEPKPEKPKPAAPPASSSSGGGPGSFLDKVVDTLKQAVGLGGPAGNTKTFEEPDPEPMTREDKPRKNIPYILDIDGVLTRGNADNDGRIELSIPPNARSGKLILDAGTVNEQTIPLNLGHLDPVDVDSGVAQRLNNLGFPCGDGTDEATMSAALKAFQEKNGLRVSGSIDDATRNKLKDLHGS
jgi:N-acetylmuramoyl-L-alanine amidase